MKWVFLLFLAGLTPALTNWLKANRRHAPKVWMLIGFLPFVTWPWHLYVAPVSWPVWPGYVKGIEISFLDAIALAVYLSTPPARRLLPFKIPLFAYLVMILLSALQSEVPVASLFAAFQFARMILVIAAVSSACADRRAPSAIIAGMVAGLTLQALTAGKDHFSGAFQTGGSLGHQNLLGLMSHFVVFPAAALLLSGRPSRAAIVGPLAGTAAVILTASRATLGLAPLGYAATILVSIMRKPSQRKTVIAVAGAVVIALATPLALATLDTRFEIAPLSQDYDERAAFERAAKLIIGDHPMGVGANDYVIVVNTRGYAERAGIEPTYGSRSANVHNVYLLIAAETGILGAVVFVVSLLFPALYALTAYFRNRATPDNELLLGLGVSILIVAVHSMYEWIFVVFSSQYLFATCVGLIGGITARARFIEQRRRKRRKPVVEVAREDARAGELVDVG